MDKMEKMFEALFKDHGQDTVEGRALECQIAFKNGQAMRGGLKHGPVDGSYVLLTPILDQRTKQPVSAIEVHFIITDDITYIGIPCKMAQPAIVAPDGAPAGQSGLVLP